MRFRQRFVMSPSLVRLHDDLPAKTIFPEQVVAQFAQIGHFVIIDADKDRAVFAQKFPRQL